MVQWVLAAHGHQTPALIHGERGFAGAQGQGGLCTTLAPCSAIPRYPSPSHQDGDQPCVPPPSQADGVRLSSTPLGLHWGSQSEHHGSARARCGGSVAGRQHCCPAMGWVSDPDPVDATAQEQHPSSRVYFLLATAQKRCCFYFHIFPVAAAPFTV